MNIRTQWLAIAALASLAGCTAGNGSLRPLAALDIPNNEDGVAAALSPRLTLNTKPIRSKARCELRLFAEQLPNGDSQGIASGALGAFIVEREGENLAQKLIVPGVCIKREGEALQLPASILIGADLGGPDLERFCRSPVREDYFAVPPSGSTLKGPQRLKACTWDGTFHSTRPFTFILLTDKTAAVADYVEALRVYRNGDLMAAWNRVSDQPEPHRVVLQGTMMKANALAATYPPHRAAMDLRIVPHQPGITLVVEQETRNDRALLEAKLMTGLNAAAGAGLTADELKSFNCLKTQLTEAARELKRVVTRQATSPAFPTGCAPLTTAGGATPLSDDYSNAKSKAAEDLKLLVDRAETEIVSQRAELTSKLPDRVKAVLDPLYQRAKAGLTTEAAKAAADACIRDVGIKTTARQCFAKLRAIPGVGNALDEVAKTAIAVDANVIIALGAADEAHLLASRLYARGRETLESPQKQAQIFNAFAESLSARGDVFEPRRDNPPLIASEQKIEMQYSDRFQAFLLSPWNGVPLNFHGGGADADLSAAVALPIVDLAGVRAQWSRSRFADFRAAIGIGYLDTTKPGTEDHKSAALPNVSLGLGTFKAGIGIALGDKDLGKGVDLLRVIVGADLFKLVSGSNVEAW